MTDGIDEESELRKSWNAEIEKGRELTEKVAKLNALLAQAKSCMEKCKECSDTKAFAEIIVGDNG